MSSKRTPNTKRKSNQFKPKGLFLVADQCKYKSTSGRFIVDDVNRIGPRGVNTPISPKDAAPTNVDESTTTTTTMVEDVATTSLIEFDDLEVSKKSLGSGATANVKKCKHRVTNENYALKEIVLDKTTTDEKHKIIVSEFKALKESQDNQYIIKLFDAYHRENKLYMVLEFMDCGSLADVLKYTERIDEAVIRHIAEQLLHGLKFLHESKSIVHRDIKPENILVNSKGEIKLADFGMAGFGKQGEKQQAFKTFLGTCLFMSPERIKGEEHGYDSDIWSIGLTLAQLVLGKCPLDQKAYWDLVLELKQQELENTHNSSASLDINFEGVEISDEFKDFLDQCLKLQPYARPTASALLKHDFIRKNEVITVTDGSGEIVKKKRRSPRGLLKKWLYDTYIPNRKSAEKEKRGKKG